MQNISNWTAKRAGGRITVYGVSDGRPLKVVGVDKIEAGGYGENGTDHGGQIVATDRNGARYRLLPH